MIAKTTTRKRGRPVGSKKLVVKRDGEVAEKKVSKVVVFEKHKVLKILAKGHTKTHWHCQMDGGITQHVPKRLF